MIADNLARVQARIAAAARAAGRDAAEVTLVAVSKTFPPERVEAAYAAGARHFGENRVQEGVAKVEATHLPDATWHLIGHLQTNKARAAARAFAVIESVDSLRIATALSAEACRIGRTLDVLIEVNVGDEESKSGYTCDAASVDAPAIAALPGLAVRGVMTVAPLVDDAEQVRPVFRTLRALSERVRADLGANGLWHLSMGMSNDFEVAIQEGATIVRIGRAIFGER